MGYLLKEKRVTYVQKMFVGSLNSLKNFTKQFRSKQKHEGMGVNISAGVKGTFKSQIHVPHVVHKAWQCQSQFYYIYPKIEIRLSGFGTEDVRHTRLVQFGLKLRATITGNC